jgi:hypothetical protein
MACGVLSSLHTRSTDMNTTKKTRKPLSLDREILRTLQSVEIAKVVGAGDGDPSIPQCWQQSRQSGHAVCCG